MDWPGISQAILDRERVRLGLPSRMEEAAAKLKLAEGQSTLDTQSAQRDLLRAQIAAMPEEQRIRRESTIALTGLRDAQTAKAATPPPEKHKYVGATDKGGAYTGVFYNENDPTDIQMIPQLKGLRPKAEATPPMTAGTNAAGQSVWGVKGAPGFNPPQTTVERTRQDQAAHVISQANAFLQEMQNPATRQLFGGVGGYLAEQRQKPGLLRAIAPNPEEASHAKSALASLSAFLPIMHGMRGGENMIGHFEHVLGDFTSTPEQVEAATRAIGEAARRIREQGDAADLTDLAPSGGHSAPALAAPGPPGAPAAPDAYEGRTATGPNGEKVIRKGGQWVPLQ